MVLSVLTTVALVVRMAALVTVIVSSVVVIIARIGLAAAGAGRRKHAG